jgi:DNA repair protein RadA/Sms
LARRETVYVCTACEATFLRWSGRCPNCQEWDSLQERISQPERTGTQRTIGAGLTPPVRLSDVTAERLDRISTGTPELDRVLGGGVLPGSTILLGGEPGIGKSTLLLQALGHMSGQATSCLYVSCEESLSQLRLRADRLGLSGSGMPAVAENSLDNILELCRVGGPQVIAVDSIQRVNAEGIDSPPGSLRQVSLCATALTEACKAANCALFLVGHVTKQGLLAGPRALEHLVDTVLYFESERFHALRILRATKNRFGAIDEIGVFEMTGDGLIEVGNPSAMFLAERDASASGSVVTATVEGSRALLVELQALVGPTSYGVPERKASGMDYRRFSMLLSVLERQAGIELGRCDAFVNVPGGMRVMEPAADLPLCIALASSFRNIPFGSDAIAVGEVGLGGEVRAVNRIEERLREARRLGFEGAVVPAGNAKSAGRLMGRVHPVRGLSEAIRLLGGQR